jgi:hypothetical protein
MTKQFRYYSPQEFHGLYRQIGCVPKRIRLKEEQMRVWSLAKEDLDKLGKISPYTDMNMDFSKFAEDEKF